MKHVLRGGAGSYVYGQWAIVRVPGVTTSGWKYRLHDAGRIAGYANTPEDAVKYIEEEEERRQQDAD